MAENPKQSERADRILDAAQTLLLRLGYRKVTIEDIANRAGVGKGTVYLHWHTKQRLFHALILRESSAIGEELVGLLQRDPEQVRPHHFMRTSFLLNHRTPLIHAVVTQDAELLGSLQNGPLHSKQLVASDQFFALMCRFRLLRDDIPNLAYALRAASSGFYLFDTLSDEAADLTAEDKADALAHTVRHAFEPATEPDEAAVVAAAFEIRSLLEDLLSSIRKWIYTPNAETDPAPEVPLPDTEEAVS